MRILKTRSILEWTSMRVALALASTTVVVLCAIELSLVGADCPVRNALHLRRAKRDQRYAVGRTTNVNSVSNLKSQLSCINSFAKRASQLDLRENLRRINLSRRLTCGQYVADTCVRWKYSVRSAPLFAELFPAVSASGQSVSVLILCLAKSRFGQPGQSASTNDRIRPRWSRL